MTRRYNVGARETDRENRFFSFLPSETYFVYYTRVPKKDETWENHEKREQIADELRKRGENTGWIKEAQAHSIKKLAQKIIDIDMLWVKRGYYKDPESGILRTDAHNGIDLIIENYSQSDFRELDQRKERPIIWASQGETYTLRSCGHVYTTPRRDLTLVEQRDLGNQIYKILNKRIDKEWTSSKLWR